MSSRNWMFLVKWGDRRGYLTASGELVQSDAEVLPWPGTDAEVVLEADRRVTRFETDHSKPIDEIVPVTYSGSRRVELPPSSADLF